MVFGLILLIVGVIIVGVAGDLIDVLQKEVCKASTQSNENIAAQYRTTIIDNMCTDTCKCAPGDDSSTQKLW